jgi:hypothetical protein
MEDSRCVIDMTDNKKEGKRERVRKVILASIVPAVGIHELC